MADLIYTPNPASITRFLRHIQSAGVPPRLSRTYLTSVGFRSSNDRYLVGILKSLGFADRSGVPTDRWKAYRDTSQSKEVLGLAIREAYADLFATYPNADQKDTEALRNYFSAQATVAESTLRLAVATFKALAAEASFEKVSQPRPKAQAQAAPTPAKTDGAGDRLALPLNVSIVLQIPATDDAEVYEKLFAALRKHLIE